MHYPLGDAAQKPASQEASATSGPDASTAHPHGDVPVSSLVAVANASLAPAGEANVARRSIFYQSTPVISPPVNIPADIAYGVLGCVLAEVSSPGREFGLACVPAWAQLPVVAPLSVSESLMEVAFGAVGGEPGVADVFPQQTFLAPGRVQGYLVRQDYG